MEKKRDSSDTVFVGARQACQNLEFHAQSSPGFTQNGEMEKIVCGLQLWKRRIIRLVPVMTVVVTVTKISLN